MTDTMDILQRWKLENPQMLYILSENTVEEKQAVVHLKGGKGSGFHGHAGRPGMVGGSSSEGSGGSSSEGSGASSYQFSPGTSDTDDNDDRLLRYFTSGNPSIIADDVRHVINDRIPSDNQIIRDNLINMVQAEEEKVTNLSFVSTNVDSFLKAQNVAYLSAETGIDPDTINRTIESWALTSNDNNPNSLYMQKAAADEFGIDMSDWQKERLDHVNSLGSDVLQSKGLLDIPDESRRSILRAMYERTQQDFQDAGFSPDDLVTIHRGFVSDNLIGKEGDTVSYKGNAMESWSFDKNVASSFATGITEVEGNYGYILSMKIPVRNILCTPRTGYGCWSEAEVITFGNIPEQKVRIFQFNDLEGVYNDSGEEDYNYYH